MKAKSKLPAAPPRKRDWKIREAYHVYQRGSRRQRVFQNRAQLLAYLDRFDRLARRYRVRIHAFCLMSNHVHFVLEPLQKWGISQLMQHLQSHYARSVHKALGVDGHLWRNHFHCKHIQSARQYRATILYVEQNPTAAGVAKRAHLYEYSSAPAHQANQAVHKLRHQNREVCVRLHLGRWRKEFGPSTDWAAWLRSPRDAAHQAEITEVERVLGADREKAQRQTALPPTSQGKLAQVSVRANAAVNATVDAAGPHTSHGWTRQ